MHLQTYFVQTCALVKKTSKKNNHWSLNVFRYLISLACFSDIFYGNLVGKGINLRIHQTLSCKKLKNFEIYSAGCVEAGKKGIEKKSIEPVH